VVHGDPHTVLEIRFIGPSQSPVTLYGYSAWLPPEAITLDKCGYLIVDANPPPRELVDGVRRPAQGTPVGTSRCGSGRAAVAHEGGRRSGRMSKVLVDMNDAAVSQTHVAEVRT
jgi:hypothetical protein